MQAGRFAPGARRVGPFQQRSAQAGAERARNHPAEEIRAARLGSFDFRLTPVQHGAMRKLGLWLAAAVLAWPSGAEVVQFSGRVLAGDLYERPLPRGLMFCLLPGGKDGREVWTIAIARVCSYDADDFASIATPPYRGANALFLMAFHFLPDVKLFRNTRKFRFVLNEQDHARILFMLQNEKHYEAQEILDTARRLGKGEGELEVTDVKIIPAKEHVRTQFVRMSFRVKLKFPEKE